MLKAFHFIEDNLISNDFKIIESDMLWHTDSALFYYAMQNDKLPKTIEVLGPPLKIKQHVDLFKKKHKKTKTKNKRIFATENRKFTNAKDLIKNLIKTSNVKINIKNIDII